MRIAVVSPHRGDAAFGLGLAIGAWVAAGNKVVVVNCFSRSEFAPYSDVGSVHANDRVSFATAVRHREDVSWQRMFGNALTLEDLNLKDAPLRMHIPAKDVASVKMNATDKGLLKIQKALEKLQANAVVLPLALGGDVDHRVAREAATAQVNWALPCCFYEELPDALEMSDETIVTEAGAVGKAAGVELAPVFGSAVSEEAEKLKLRMVLRYDSQVNDETAERIAAFSKRYEGRERLWGNAAWLGSKLAI